MPNEADRHEKTPGEAPRNPRSESTLSLPPGPPAAVPVPAPEAPAPNSELETLVFPGGPPRREPIAPEGPRFGRYEILAEVARGGMGIVYKARDPQLNRTVALKVMIAGELASKEDILRFHVEAKAAARLRHPNIVAIHDVGTEEGRQYFTMDFVEGEPLSRTIQQRKLDLRRSLEILEKTARAVHFAHTQGIVHRDLKPSNVLLDERGEPQVTDFGLAKDIETDFTLTQSGAAMGTPNYMSPEQANGESHHVDARSDVFSLGAMMYEMITGRPPFTADNRYRMLYLLIREDPVRPSVLSPSVPAEVETICLKCLAKERERRYPTAAAFADDLRRFLDGQPIEARPSSLFYRTKKRLQRNRALTASVALAVLVAAGLLTGWIITLQRRTRQAEQARDEAQAAKIRAEEQRTLAEQRELTARRFVYAGQMRRIQEAWQKRETVDVLRLLDSLRPGEGQEDLRGWEWRYFWGLCHAERLTLQHPVGVFGVAFSPDGKCLATSCEKNTVRLWDPSTGAERAVLEGPGADLRAVAISPDGQFLAAGGEACRVRIWHLPTRKELATLKGHAATVNSLAFSCDSTLLAGASEDAVMLWEAPTWKELAPLRNLGGKAHCVAFAPRGKVLAVGCGGGTVQPGVAKLFDLAANKELATLSGHAAYVGCLAFSPDGARLATASWDRSMMLWDTATWKRTAICGFEQPNLCGLAFSPDGKTVAVAVSLSENKGAETLLWDVAASRQLAALSGHTWAIFGIAFSPDGQTVATASGDHTAKLWDVAAPALFANNGVETTLLEGHGCALSSNAAFSPDGRRLLTLSCDESARLWDLASGEELKKIEMPVQALKTTAFSPDARLLATAGDDKTVTLWDLTAGRAVRTIGRPFVVRDVAFSPDGKTLAICGNGVEFELWDVADGRQVAGRRAEGYVHGLAFSPDGAILATAGSVREAPGTMKLWSVQKGEELATLKGHEWLVRSLAFSPDGKFLATSSLDHTVRIWDVATGQERVASRKGAMGPAGAVRFSPDGRFLVLPSEYALSWLGSGTGFLTVWGQAQGGNAPGGKPSFEQRETRIRAHSTHIRCAEFSPDGRTFVSGADDGTLKVWDIPSWQVRATLKGHACGITSLAFSPDGKTLAAGKADFSIQLFDTEARRERKTLTGHTDVVCSVAFSPDGAALASGGCDQTVKLWDLATGRPRLSLPARKFPVRSVAFSPDGRILASGDGAIDNREGQVTLWDSATGKERAALPVGKAMIRCVTFAPDGKTLAAAIGDGWCNLLGEVQLWDVAAASRRTTLPRQVNPTFTATFSADGATLAAAGYDRTIKLWDAAAGTERAALHGHEEPILSIAFAPDGKSLVSGDMAGTVKLWDLAIGQERATLKAHPAAVTAVAFSPDGKLLATASADGTLKLWRTTWEEKQNPRKVANDE